MKKRKVEIRKFSKDVICQHSSVRNWLGMLVMRNARYCREEPSYLRVVQSGKNTTGLSLINLDDQEAFQIAAKKCAKLVSAIKKNSSPITQFMRPFSAMLDQPF